MIEFHALSYLILYLIQTSRHRSHAAMQPCSNTRVSPRPGLARCHALLHLASDSLTRARKQGKTERRRSAYHWLRRTLKSRFKQSLIPSPSLL